MELRMFGRFVLALLLIAPPSVSVAQSGPFDPRKYQTITGDEVTQVLVIGTPHLSGVPDGFDPAVLEPVLARLETFAPDIITIEALSGESLETLRDYRGIYQTTAEDFGRRTLTIAALARAAVGLDLPEAEAEARKALAALPAEPTASERRHLAALFAASGDPHSALLQWRRLGSGERKAGDGVTTELAAALDRLDVGKNENQMIGVTLAARLGLERIYPADDHSSDDIP
ncbi:hypothetical protein EON82_26395, partial [bacterium]